MKRIPIILAVLLIAGFAVLGVSNITERENKVRFQRIELESTSNKLKLNELKQQKLSDEIQNTLQQKNVTDEKVKQLEEANKQLEAEKQELQKQVSAKKEAQRLAQEKINNAANSVTMTARASAAPAPVAQATGSGCEWVRSKLSAMGVSSGDMPAALFIAQKESGCRPGAQNPNGGACNVFQELPCGKWGGLGNTDAHLQSAINYAQNRYGGWWGAHAFWTANHWW